MGMIGLVTGGFAPIWGGVPKDLPDRQLLAYLCTLLSLACGAGLLAKRTAPAAALLLLVYLSAWTIFFKVPFIIREPLVEGSYQSTGENLVLVAAAWALYAELANGRLAGKRGSSNRLRALRPGPDCLWIVPLRLPQPHGAPRTGVAARARVLGLFHWVRFIS